jgi:hypothetical protein
MRVNTDGTIRFISKLEEGKHLCLSIIGSRLSSPTSLEHLYPHHPSAFLLFHCPDRLRETQAAQTGGTVGGSQSNLLVFVSFHYTRASSRPGALPPFLFP